MDNFYRMAIVNKLRDLVPGSVNTIILLETTEQIRMYLSDVLEDNTEFVESLIEEDDLQDERNAVKKELDKLFNLRQMILFNPTGRVNN